MSVAATGFFDGVHIGHQEVIRRVIELSNQRGLKSQVITFWPHPRSVLQQDAFALRLLTSLQEKKAIIQGLGIDKFTVLNFTKEFSKLSSAEFIKEYIINQCGVKILIVGYDHKIGHDQQTQQQMIEKCEKAGLEVYRVEERAFGSESAAEVVSSTKIRNLLQEGNVVVANNYLGYNYTLKGVVVSGNRIGRTIGFPTANINLYDPLKMIPKPGVYIVEAQVESEPTKRYVGITNIGYRPTIGNNTQLTIETHILNFSEDIYGLDLTISFRERMRDEMKFASLEDLKKQLTADKEIATRFSL